ncbi:MarR family transcriptional regulator [Nocardioides albertanoniae]|uniref:MarR family transcriptional regulator n=1 Tax=Nocardioides albertanoniae TaxID=1175486 RepID=A0A543A3D9_9ACTN|nr:MarR family transcriptional regulator [Nocardioides albertanoniae]TQL67105.1 MarR family transcriptional regulator [Nocardioides albertanoniae]
MPTAQSSIAAGATSDIPEVASSLRTSVMRMRRRLANERHPDNDLSLGSMAVLGALFANDEMTLGALAARERVQPPSMTRMVNCLEEGGYVARRQGETDRRQVLVSITDKGRRTVRKDRLSRDAWLARQLADIDADELAALRTAATIMERIATS